jgi:hypothetical protein
MQGREARDRLTPLSALSSAFVKDDLDGLLANATLVTLAFAVALGWSLYQFAHGVATFVDALTAHLPADVTDGRIPYFAGEGGGLTWIVGRRVVTLDGIVMRLVELAVVLLAAVFVHRRRVRAETTAD